MKKNVLLITIMLFAFVAKINAQSVYFDILYANKVSSDDEYSICSADMNGDNIEDIVTSIDHYVEININDGSGNFSTQYFSIGVNSDEIRCDAKDIDNDGDIDLILAVSDSDYPEYVIWEENDGNLNFTEHIVYEENVSNYTIRSIVASDIDNDGDMDIISVGTNTIWHENDGNQNFTQHIIGGASSYSIMAVDMDNDNDLDILTSNEWYENDGTQNFTSHFIASSYASYAIDVDGDNDIDIVSSRDDIKWWENDGSQNFTEHIIVPNGNIYYSICVYAVDIEADGDVDILYGNNYTSNTGYDDAGTYLLFNDGNQSFTKRQITIVDPNSVYAIDVNGDNKINIIADAYDGTYTLLYWFEQLECTVNTSNIIGNPNPDPYEELTYVVTNTTGSSYEWIVEGGAVTTGNGTNTVDVMWNANGYGSLCVIETDEHGCVGDTVCLNITVNVEDIASSKQFGIYPNPTSANVQITMNNAQIGSTIEITDINGKLVKQLVVNNEQLTIDLSKETKGIYFVKLIGETGVSTQKLILE